MRKNFFKKNIKELVKRIRIFYTVYYFIGTTFINILKLFIKTDNYLILFVSFGGRYMNDSPKMIYDAMILDERFTKYKLVWAFTEPKTYDNVFKVKIDSLRYYITALKARCWITNVMIERALGFKGKNTFYFHTTHGTLPKLTGNHVKQKHIFYSKHPFQFDLSCAQSHIEAQLQEEMYNLTPEKIIISGYPKNDALCNKSDKYIKNIRVKFNISDEKYVILYAPTFREKISNNTEKINFNKWKKILGNDFIVLLRTHPVYSENYVFNDLDGFIIDVSKYPDNNDLMIASDLLISDYSAIIFEYVVLNKPVLCFAYDYDDYIKTRGLYFDVRDEIFGGHLNEEELLEYIRNKDFNESMKKTLELRKKYVSEYGHATKICVDAIYEQIKE